MSGGDLPPPVRQFLVEHIESYEALELLLWLSGQAGKEYSSAEAGSSIGIPSEHAGEVLDQLVEGGLASSRDTGGMRRFRYLRRSDEEERVLSDLRHARETNLVGIVRAMSENAIQRIKGGMLRTFADAFLLKRKKKDG